MSGERRQCEYCKLTNKVVPVRFCCTRGHTVDSNALDARARADALTAAKAAGYAEAVADIRMWLVADAKATRARKAHAEFRALNRAIGALDRGAHVGAAKAASPKEAREP